MYGPLNVRLHLRCSEATICHLKRSRYYK